MQRLYTRVNQGDKNPSACKQHETSRISILLVFIFVRVVSILLHILHDYFIDRIHLWTYFSGQRMLKLVKFMEEWQFRMAITVDCCAEMLIYVHSGRPSTVSCVEVRELFRDNLRNNSEGISSETGNSHGQKLLSMASSPNHFVLCWRKEIDESLGQMQWQVGRLHKCMYRVFISVIFRHIDSWKMWNIREI
jgi:hypothetical protein